MKANRARQLAALGLAVGALTIPPLAHSQAPINVNGWATGQVLPNVVEAGRPWGWAVRAYMENPNQQLYNKAKAKLLAGEQVFSHTISSLNVERYCREAPHFDFTWFELQHSTMSFDDVRQMIQACPRLGAAPIVRIPEAQEGFVQKAMDMGALGVIVPTVDDFIEARNAARWVRFPPRDRRSCGCGNGGIWADAVPAGDTWRNTINDNMLVIVMIETIEGVNNAYEIASQPGVDVVILGNSDLSSFSGFESSAPEYRDLLIRVRNATNIAGKFWGNAGQAFATGNPLSPDSRLHQNGRTNDGWMCNAEGCTAPAR
jgi:2-keto-3-deoxy-L-rhamnonate aldolase RhmA